MTIKKSIVGSLFSMLLVSEIATAGWGDVYYCQMTNNNEISFEGETLGKYKLEKFKFKLDQTRNAMVFGNTGHFKDESFQLSVDMRNDKDPEEVTIQDLMILEELWTANGGDSNTRFSKGKFSYASVDDSSSVTITWVHLISADCDKF